MRCTPQPNRARRPLGELWKSYVVSRIAFSTAQKHSSRVVSRLCAWYFAREIRAPPAHIKYCEQSNHGTEALREPVAKRKRAGGGSMSRAALPDQCERCGAATRIFRVSLDEAVMLCSAREVCCVPTERSLEPFISCSLLAAEHFLNFRAHLRSTFLQCLWPLDVADDVDGLCVPASDPRVIAASATPLAPEPTGHHSQPPSVPQQQHPPMPPPPTRGLQSFGHDSDTSDELQHISNMLFQPSPACSPHLGPSPSMGPGMMRLPSIGGSLPTSVQSTPARGATLGADVGLPAFELPPSAVGPELPAALAARRPLPPECNST